MPPVWWEKKNLLGRMEKHCTKWAITWIPFGTFVLLLSASEILLSGEKRALLAVRAELLARALCGQPCCSGCCCLQLCLWQLLGSPTVRPHSQPNLQPSQKKLQNQELYGLPLVQTPALLAPALGRATGSSASVSWSASSCSWTLPTLKQTWFSQGTC